MGGWWVGVGRGLSFIVEVEVEVSLEVEVSFFVGGVWFDVSLEVEVSFFVGGVLLGVSLEVEVVGNSSFIGLVMFDEGSTEDSRYVFVWVIGLVSVITGTGLCVIISCVFWSSGQTCLCSDGQWFWSDGQGWNSMQV